MIKCVVLVCHSQMDSGGRKGKMDPRYDKRSTCSWNNRPIGQVQRLLKEPMLKRCHWWKSGLSCTYLCSCCDSDDPWKCMSRYWYTKNWVRLRGLWQWRVERLKSRNLVKIWVSICLCEKVLMLVLFKSHIVLSLFFSLVLMQVSAERFI